MANPIIAAHMAIYEAHHDPAGITLAESARDWRDLLDEDPGMQLAFNWGDLARTATEEQIAGFREWLNEQTGGASDRIPTTSEACCETCGRILDCCNNCPKEADR